MGPKCYAEQCTVNGVENPQKLPLRLRISSLLPPLGGGPSHGDKQHAQKIDKDRASGSEDMLADKQTDTHRREPGEVTNKQTK